MISWVGARAVSRDRRDHRRAAVGVHSRSARDAACRSVCCCEGAAVAAVPCGRREHGAARRDECRDRPWVASSILPPNHFGELLRRMARRCTCAKQSRRRRRGGCARPNLSADRWVGGGALTSTHSVSAVVAAAAAITAAAITLFVAAAAAALTLVPLTGTPLGTAGPASDHRCRAAPTPTTAPPPRGAKRQSLERSLSFPRTASGGQSRRISAHLASRSDLAWRRAADPIFYSRRPESDAARGQQSGFRGGGDPRHRTPPLPPRRSESSDAYGHVRVRRTCAWRRCCAPTLPRRTSAPRAPTRRRRDACRRRDMSRWFTRWPGDYRP